MVTRYRSGWDYESLNEFTTVYVVRWRGKDGKRYASPFKTKDSADNKAKEYRSQGNKEVTVTQDTLRGNIKFKSDNSPDIKGMQKEDVGDYLRSKMNPTQIANIKKVWQGKKASDVTPAVKAMIKRLDIPTQLAIKQANIPHISKLVEDKDDAYNSIYESAAAKEIDRTNTRKDSMDYKMYKKAVDLLRSKKYNELKTFLKKSDTAPREYVMSTIANKEPATFKKMYGNQTGYYSLMSQVKEDASKDAENMAKLRTRQMALQTKLKDLDPGESKDKTPMAIAKNDIQTIQMKMDQLRSKMKKEQVHPAKSLIEAITAVKNKAEKTGMPYSILKKVYDRGMAAWKGGHRPGTTPQQWAMARVNSFVTKSSGTWGKADKDLAAKVRSKK